MTRARDILSVLLLVLLLAGCGSRRLAGTTETPVPTRIPTSVPSATLQPSDTVTSLPSATVQPSDTPSPAPTATWVPTVTPRPASPTPAISDGLLAAMDAIGTEVEDLRDLEQSGPMTRTLMTRDELASYLEDEFAQEYPAEEIADDVLVLAAFDFVPRDLDLLQVLLDLYSSEVLGLYDDELDTFCIVTSGEFDLRNRLTYAHEFVHGLQDQNLGLDDFVDGDKLNDDELLARLALVEGDATLAMSEYLFAHLSEVSAEELQALVDGDGQDSEAAVNAAPPIIRETFSFPYTYGLDFVSLLQEEGWQAVDGAYTDPPQSTEQILHPEKYLSRDEPEIITLPPLTDTLGTGWRLVEADTLGEFQTGLYLAQQVDQETADLASRGWDGDQYAVYAQDGATVLAFATVWDTGTDREEFVSAYTQYAEAKFSQLPTRSSESELWWEIPSQVGVLTWTDNRVLVILGPDTEMVAQALAVTRPK
jgi:hypothetical protein